MKYIYKLDKDNYIFSLAKSPDDKGIDISSIDLEYLNCYKIVDDKPVLDENKKSVLIEEAEKYQRIAELRTLLTESDDIIGGMIDGMASLTNPVTFISDFVKLIGDMNSKYAELIVQRKAWREELESLLK